MDFVFAWFFSHWPTLAVLLVILILLWKFGKAFTAVSLWINDFITGFQKAEVTLDKVATNHIPHLQMELEKANGGIAKTNEHLEGLRDDIRRLADAVLDKE